MQNMLFSIYQQLRDKSLRIESTCTRRAYCRRCVLLMLMAEALRSISESHRCRRLPAHLGSLPYPNPNGRACCWTVAGRRPARCTAAARNLPRGVLTITLPVGHRW